MSLALGMLAIMASYFAGKHRGRGEGFAQGWLVGWYMRAPRWTRTTR